MVIIVMARRRTNNHEQSRTVTNRELSSNRSIHHHQPPKTPPSRSLGIATPRQIRLMPKTVLISLPYFGLCSHIATTLQCRPLLPFPSALSAPAFNKATMCPSNLWPLLINHNSIIRIDHDNCLSSHHTGDYLSLKMRNLVYGKTPGEAYPLDRQPQPTVVPSPEFQLGTVERSIPFATSASALRSALELDGESGVKKAAGLCIYFPPSLLILYYCTLS
jgi:hypothetical protein